MKIGVISDIHGNIVALEKVLNEFEKIGVEKIICCGDVIGIGPCPEEAVQKLIQYKDKIIGVRGNHEQYYFKGIPKEIHDDKRLIRDEEANNHKWTHSKLSNESIEFLKGFPIMLITVFGITTARALIPENASSSIIVSVEGRMKSGFFDGRYDIFTLATNFALLTFPHSSKA